MRLCKMLNLIRNDLTRDYVKWSFINMENPGIEMVTKYEMDKCGTSS